MEMTKRKWLLFKITAGKSKIENKANYGDNFENKQQDNLFRSMVDNRVSNIATSEANYIDAKNTIASGSSKKTSNNTS
jgi:hypothetical protein